MHRKIIGNHYRKSQMDDVMKTYKFNAIVGTDSQGVALYQEFVIQAESFAQARHILSTQLENLR